MNYRYKKILLSLAVFLLAANSSSGTDNVSAAYSLSSNISFLDALSYAIAAPQTGAVYQLDESVISQIRKDLKNLSQSSGSVRGVPLERSAGDKKSFAGQIGGDLAFWQVEPAIQDSEIFDPASLGMLQPPGIIEEGAIGGSRQSSGGVTVIWSP